MGNEVNDRRLSGMATGVVNCVGFLGAAVVPVIMGKVLDSYQDTQLVGYEKAYFVLIMIIAVSVVDSHKNQMIEFYGLFLYLWF